MARKWRVNMIGAKKIHKLGENFISLEDNIRDKIQNVVPQAFPDDSESINNILQKDVHLIEAAMAMDKIIVSCDDTAKLHFGRISGRIKEIQSINWVNPVENFGEIKEWLESGAELKDEYRLQPGE